MATLEGREGTFQKSLELREGRPRFVFYEGPPTANGKPATHHILARAFKDLFGRYKTMRGFYVERKAGWDTHGLPVEIEVEKKLNISGKFDDRERDRRRALQRALPRERATSTSPTGSPSASAWRSGWTTTTRTGR